MPNLPFDCIANVINQIDSRHDLFTLLTVSRDVFQMAARCLYRDPLRWDWPSEWRQYDPRLSKLLCLLLSLSPTSDRQTNNLRQTVNQVNATTTTLSPVTITTTTTMLDYLSLVKVVHWGALLYYDRISLELTQKAWRNEEIISTLTWAFVGHRLEEVVELDIVDMHLRDDDDIQRYRQFGQDGGGGDGGGEEDDEDASHSFVHGDDRYLQHVSRMTSLRKIWICCSDNWIRDWKRLYSRAEKMVLAMQREHGPQHLQECRLIPNPLEKGPDASRQPWFRVNQIDLIGAQNIYSLVSTATGGLARNRYPTNSLLVVPCSGGSFIALDRLFDPDVARVQSLTGHHEKSSTGMGFHPETITRLYPDFSDAQILQRCRGLTTMHLRLIAADSDCLAWAAYEDEYRRRTCSDGARHLVLTSPTVASSFSSSMTTTTATLVNSSVIVAPLVALQNLTLDFDHTDPNITLKPLWDGLQGFSKTLESLTIKYSCHQFPSRPASKHLQQRPRVLRSSVPLPQLKRLDLEEMEIDPAFWRLAPIVEDVKIRVLPSRSITAATLSPSEDHQETTFTSTGSTVEGLGPLHLATATVAAVQAPTPGDVVLDCPVLKRLTLDKGAVHLFDPTSLKTSGRCLERLILAAACPWENTSDLGVGDFFTHAAYPCYHCCKCSNGHRMASRHAGVFAGVLSRDDDGDDKDDDNALYVRHPDRWTWDWSLPQLTYLHIHGDLLALRFDLVSLLRSYPSLIDINLGHVPERRHLQDSFPLAVKDQVLGIATAAAAVETDADAETHVRVTSPSLSLTSSSPPSYVLSAPSVWNLSLSGKWSIQATELACLLDVVLPGLRSLHVHNNLMDFMTDEHGATDYRGVVCLTKNHPALRNCLVDSLVGIEQVLQQHEQDDRKREQQAHKYLDEQLEPMGLTQCDGTGRFDYENAGAHKSHKIVYRFWNFAYQLEKGPEEVEAL